MFWGNHGNALVLGLNIASLDGDGNSRCWGQGGGVRGGKKLIKGAHAGQDGAGSFCHEKGLIWKYRPTKKN